MQFDEDDIENIRELAKRDGVVDMLTRSIAPSIFGHARMKKVGDSPCRRLAAVPP